MAEPTPENIKELIWAQEWTTKPWDLGEEGDFYPVNCEVDYGVVDFEGWWNLGLADDEVKEEERSFLSGEFSIPKESVPDVVWALMTVEVEDADPISGSWEVSSLITGYPSKEVIDAVSKTAMRLQEKSDFTPANPEDLSDEEICIGSEIGKLEVRKILQKAYDLVENHGLTWEDVAKIYERGILTAQREDGSKCFYFIKYDGSIDSTTQITEEVKKRAFPTSWPAIDRYLKRARERSNSDTGRERENGGPALDR